MFVQQVERVAQRLIDGACTQVGSADADAEDHLRQVAQTGGFGFDRLQLLFAEGGGKPHPAQEIVAGTLAVVQQRVGVQGCGFFLLGDCDIGANGIERQGFHDCIGVKSVLS